jgi:hypothetical protein
MTSARPPVPFKSFLSRIGLHYRAYVSLDNLPIGKILQEEWLALTHGGFAVTWADPVADLFTKMYLKRLASQGSAPVWQAMTVKRLCCSCVGNLMEVCFI